MVAECGARERMRRRTVEETVDMPVPRIQERIGETCGLVQQIAGHEDAIKDCMDQLSSEDARTEDVQMSISELDGNVTRATDVRKKQHAEIVTSTVNDDTASNLKGLYYKVSQPTRFPRIMLKSNLKSGRQDQPDQEARTSSDDQSASGSCGETHSRNIDCRIPGIPHSTVPQQDTNRKRNSQKVDSAVRESPEQGVFPAGHE